MSNLTIEFLAPDRFRSADPSIREALPSLDLGCGSLGKPRRTFPAD
jgi:hypothetical protein